MTPKPPPRKPIHPLTIGTQIRSHNGEEDGNGTAAPGSIGQLVNYLGNLGPQGHAYAVLFPMAQHAKKPDNPKATMVWVNLDQGDGLDDPEQYEILQPSGDEQLKALAQQARRVATNIGYGVDDVLADLARHLHVNIEFPSKD